MSLKADDPALAGLQSLVTTSQLVLDLDAAKAAERFTVLKFNVGDRGYAEFSRALAQICEAGPVRSVARTDDCFAYALVEGKTGYDGMRVATQGGQVRGVCVPWGELEPFMVLRLLFNSCSQTTGESDEAPNDTGRLFALSQRRKRQGLEILETVETVIDSDCIATLSIRSFTKREQLLARAGRDRKEREKIERAVGYEPTPWGSMVYAKTRDGDYVIRKPRGVKPAARREWTFASDEEKIARTKKGIFLRQLKTLAYRYGDFAHVSLKTYRRESFYEVLPSDKYTAAVKALVGEKTLAVSYAKRGLAGTARSLVKAINDADLGVGAVYRGTVVDPAAWNLIVVPDDVDENDGYALHAGVVEQHISQELCEPDKNHKRFKAVLGNICKELLVKQDVIDNTMRTCELGAYGIDALDVCTLGKLRVKGRVPADWPLHVLRLSVGPDGAMRFSARPFDLDLTDPLEMAAVSDTAENGTGAYSFEVRAGGKYMLTRIEDTGLVTYPNDFERLVDECQLKGESCRKIAVLRTFNGPLLGIGSFRIDGVVHYFVGCDRKPNVDMPTAVHVKRIEVVAGDDLTDCLVRLVNVGISRYGRPSVWPIPVKYLHEYALREFGYVGEQMTFDLEMSE